MKIQGPSSGQPPPGVDDAPDVDRSQAKSLGKSFAGQVEKSESVASAVEPGRVEADKQSLVSDLGQALETGQITSEAALDQVIDRVLDKHLGGDAPAPLRSQIESAMREALNDPVLADKIKKLSG